MCFKKEKNNLTGWSFFFPLSLLVKWEEPSSEVRQVRLRLVDIDPSQVFYLQLMHKLSVEAPPKILVERYLIEIAKNYNVPYEPDSVVMVSLVF